MTLKEILFNAFGKEFLISGGLGNSINTPIILDKDDSSNYVDTEYSLLKYIGILRGVTWEKVGQALMEYNGRYIDQIKVETIETTDTEVITQIENYYFEIDYFFRKKESEMEAAKTFDKEKTLSLILQRLEEMRLENEFNRKCIELLKTDELFDNFILFEKFMSVIFEDSSYPLFEDMSNIAKQSIMSVLSELAHKLK